MKNEKKIEDLLHLYLGCEVIWNDSQRRLLGILPFTGVANITMYDGRAAHNWVDIKDIKPILRRLDSQTREEQMEELNILKELGENGTGAEAAAELTRHRLKMGFDLYQLIDSGIAIDSNLATKSEDISSGNG